MSCSVFFRFLSKSFFTAVVFCLGSSPLYAASYFYFSAGNNAYNAAHLLTSSTYYNADAADTSALYSATGTYDLNTGVIGLGVSAGLGHKIDLEPYYIAFEIGSSTTPTQFSGDTDSSSVFEDGFSSSTATPIVLAQVQEKFNNPIIAQVKFGYHISKRMSLSLGLGLQSASYTSSYKYQQVTNDGTTASTNTADSLEVKQNTRRMRISAGMDYAVTPYTIWYVEAAYAVAQKAIEVTEDGTPTTAATGNNYNIDTVTVTPKISEVRFGLKYLV